MNITRSNFAENLQLIQEIITKSHFVAIDLEMSGIDISDQCIPSKIDSVLHDWR